MTQDGIRLEDFRIQLSDIVRYADMDRQGHVNNAVFSTFLETGRVGILYNPAASLAEAGSSFVLARLVIDFRVEIIWPGTIHIGTRVTSIGRSSVKLEQGLFQDGHCNALAETVVVLVNNATRRSMPLSAPSAKALSLLK